MRANTKNTITFHWSRMNSISFFLAFFSPFFFSLSPKAFFNFRAQWIKKMLFATYLKRKRIGIVSGYQLLIYRPNEIIICWAHTWERLHGRIESIWIKNCEIDTNFFSLYGNLLFKLIPVNVFEYDFQQ